MKSNNQNNDAQFEKLISDLKKMPKLDAPSNFEYNLMIKIQNGEFEKVKEKKESIWLWRIIPASALVLSTIILFFIIQDSSNNYIHNYLTEQPQLYTENYKVLDTLGIKAKKVSDNSETYQIVVNNDAIVEEKIKPDFLRNNQGISLDNYMSDSENRTQKQGQVLVKSQPDFQEDGFYMNPFDDIEEIARLKARMDSIFQSKLRKK
jgi:hypothetical protein